MSMSASKKMWKEIDERKAENNGHYFDEETRETIATIGRGLLVLGGFVLLGRALGGIAMRPRSRVEHRELHVLPDGSREEIYAVVTTMAGRVKKAA